MQNETQSEDTVPRLHRPSREEFTENYLRKNRPVLLTGVIDHWPALTKWTPAYLRRAIDKDVVEISMSTSGRNNKSEKSSMKADDFFASLSSPRPDANPGLHLQPTPPTLLADIEYPPYFDPADLLFKTFLCGCNTVTELHYHQSTEAFFCGIAGAKRFMFYAPDQNPFMYAEPWNTPYFQHTPVIANKPDFERFPKFRAARAIEVVVNPGELLFVPIRWWHAVYGVTQGLNVSMTLFWYADGRSILLAKHNPIRHIASLVRNRPLDVAEGLRRLVRGK